MDRHGLALATAAWFSHLPGMIRSELVARIAKQNPRLYAKDVEAVVDVIFDRIATALASGDRVELRDFGSFSTNEQQGRTARNPKTGAAVTVEAKLSIVFKPGKAMRARLNLKAKAVDPEQEAEHSLQVS